ncbi:MAG: FkbM family methyltransferase [Mucilaginibacter sp.]|nr:FkbM family methyltransferase [Mucilaginibacter sp.]
MAVFINQLKKYFSFDWIFPEIDYIQKREDIPCSLILENRENYTGFYVDIGTHHPYPFSNTSHFHQKGWQKIIIELALSSSSLFSLLSEAGVNLNAGRDAPPDRPLFSHFKNAKTNNSPAENLTRPCAIAKIINVREMSLATVLDNNLPAGQRIDFLSLDVAGFNMNALKSLDWNKYGPLFIIVKIAPGTKSGFAPVYSFLMQRNYEQVVQTERAFFFKYKSK